MQAIRRFCSLTTQYVVNNKTQLVRTSLAGATSATLTAGILVRMYQAKHEELEQKFEQFRQSEYEQHLDTRKQMKLQHVQAFRGFLKQYVEEEAVKLFGEQDNYMQQVEDGKTFSFETMCDYDMYYDGWFNRSSEFRDACRREAQREVTRMLNTSDPKNLSESHSNLFYSLLCTIKPKTPCGISDAEDEALYTLKSIGFLRNSSKSLSSQA